MEDKDSNMVSATANEENAKNFNADIRFVTNLPYSIVTDLFSIDGNV